MKRCRFLSILCAAALIMAIAVLPGCQSSTGGASASGSSAAAQQETPTLTWWLIGNGEPSNLQSVLKKVNNYTSQKIHTKLNIKVASWGTWDNKINQIVNSGEPFDIMFTNSTKYRKQVELGAFADLTDQIKTDAPELYKLVPQNVWKGVQVNGKIYAIPRYNGNAITQYWAFDDRYVKKYHLDVSNIKTFEALDKALTKIKQGEGKTCYPVKLTQSDAFSGFLNDYDDLTLGFQPVGVRADDKSHKVVYTLEQPDIMSKLKLLHKWYQKGIINPDAPTQSEPEKGRIFLSAQGFPGAEASWQANDGVPKYDIVQISSPLYTDSGIQGSLNAISANSQHKKEALKMLQLVNTDQKLLDMLCYGEEGKDFQYVNPKVVKRLSNTWGLPSYAIGTFYHLATLHNAPANEWETIKKLDDQAVSSTSLGFSPDISQLTTEITNCQAVWDKYRFELMTGASDPEAMVPKIKQELQAAGMNKLISELQKQIDAQFKK